MTQILNVNTTGTEAYAGKVGELHTRYVLLMIIFFIFISLNSFLL